MNYLIEIIHSTSIHKYKSAVEAERHLAKYPANIRMDLHGVLDILPNNIDLVKDRKKNTIACISFVGETTRDAAAKDIHERILTGQIDFGVLVFVRGKGKERFTFTDEGSKAWVNKHIPCESQGWQSSQTLQNCKSGPCIFIDDSTDHLRSTKHLLPEMTCTLFNTGIQKQLMAILRQWEESQ